MQIMLIPLSSSTHGVSRMHTTSSLRGTTLIQLQPYNNIYTEWMDNYELHKLSTVEASSNTHILDATCSTPLVPHCMITAHAHTTAGESLTVENFMVQLNR